MLNFEVKVSHLVCTSLVRSTVPMNQTVQQTGAMPLRCSSGTVLSAEESVGTVLFADF